MSMLGREHDDYNHVCYKCNHKSTARRLRQAQIQRQRSKEKRAWKKDQAD